MLSPNSNMSNPFDECINETNRIHKILQELVKSDNHLKKECILFDDNTVPAFGMKFPFLDKKMNNQTTISIVVHPGSIFNITDMTHTEYPTLIDIYLVIKNEQSVVFDKNYEFLGDVRASDDDNINKVISFIKDLISSNIDLTQ